MKSIGISGGFGASKTTVCSVIEKLGYPVFYADLEARKIMNENEQIKAQIIELIGDDAYENNVLNRTIVALRIFNNNDLKEKINSIVHPAVYDAFEAWKKNQNSELVFNESALLFETGSYKRFDKTIVVIADMETRINRVTKRDQISRTEVILRISHQLDDSIKINLSNYQLSNNDTDLILPKLLEILEDCKLN
jgi:dephospho-CoA kinase